MRRQIWSFTAASAAVLAVAVAVGVPAAAGPPAVAQLSVAAPEDISPGMTRLIAPDGQNGDKFGHSVDTSRGTVLVGAVRDGLDGLVAAGSAYVYNRRDVVSAAGSASLPPRAKLTASDAADRDMFGFSVALSGDTAVVGAYGADTVAGKDAGAAYIFTRSGDTWTQQAKLTSPEAAAGAQFGMSVDVDGDTVAVIAPMQNTARGRAAGATYVFVRTGDNWNLQARLAVSSPAAKRYNESTNVTIGGDTLAIGAGYEDTAAGVDAGAIYVFTRSGGTWAQQARLEASTPGAYDTFGSAVAVGGDTLVAGTPHDDIGGAPDVGTVSVFVRTGDSWSIQSVLERTGAEEFDVFGLSVDVSGDVLVASAPYDNLGPGRDQGSVDVYRRTSGSWNRFARLTAGDFAADSALFGVSVAVEGSLVAVGANLDPGRAEKKTGAAYVFG